MRREFRRGPVQSYAYVLVDEVRGTSRAGTLSRDQPAKPCTDAPKLIAGLVKKGYVEIERGRFAKAPSLELTPGEWAMATWRARKPASRPAPRAFDREACLDALRKVEVRPYDWNFRASYPPAMSPLEATFWHEACARWSPKTTPDAVAMELASLPFDAPLTADRIPPMPTRWERAPLIAALLGTDGFLDFLLRGPVSLVPDWLLLTLVDVVLPAMSEDDRARWRDRLRPSILPSRWPEANDVFAPREFYVAALLGMSKELGEVVASWPAHRYAAPPDKPWLGAQTIKSGHPYLLVYGLETADRVQAEIARLGIACGSYWGQTAGWLAHTETSALDYFQRAVEGGAGPAKKKSDPGDPRYAAEYQLRACFDKVHEPTLAPWMTRQLAGDARGAARSWLLENAPDALDAADL